MNSPSYCAIIGDIDESRSLKHRDRVQRALEQSLETVNREFAGAITSTFLITLGDEFQGLLTSAAESFRLVRRMQSLMRPVSLSFGIGIGPLSTALKPVALGMDGEAFHRSREALRSAKSDGKGHVVFSFPGPAMSLVNVLVWTADARLERLGPTTVRIHEMMREKKTQAQVAKALKMTQQGVSRALRSKALREVAEIEGAVHGFLLTLANPASPSPRGSQKDR